MSEIIIRRDSEGRIVQIDEYGGKGREYIVYRDSERRVEGGCGNIDFLKEVIGNDRGLIEIDSIENGSGDTNIITINNTFISVNGRVPDENIKKDRFYYEQKLAEYFNSLFQRSNDFWTQNLVRGEISLEKYNRVMNREQKSGLY